ncbi:MAG: hypothetical protein LBS92_04635 [Candidatus Methanoplasma sp.]|jgi:iron complex transport system substrate-binding protein|nr:hypothetical protein [Candidatus Methanoplasma sp.]
MEAVKLKLAASCVIAVLVVTLSPAMGLTVAERDELQGVMIDFGYWDVVWTPVAFFGGMDGYSALEEAAHVNGYDVVYRDETKTEVFSINEQVSLFGVKWGMYLLSEAGWLPSNRPLQINV